MTQKRRASDRFLEQCPSAKLVQLTMNDSQTQDKTIEFLQSVAASHVTNDPSLSADQLAFEMCITHASRLSVEFHAVVVDEEILAVQATEFPTGDCYVAHFLRRRRGFVGLIDYFDIMLAQHAQGRGYTLYNIGEDLGLAHLRRGKRNWEPIELLRSYELQLC